MTNEGDREARVRDAVIAFVEAGERPDRHRLALIEQRLLAKRRRRAVPWWWIVLGIGLVSGAAASYWAATRDEAVEPAPVEDEPATAADELVPTTATGRRRWSGRRHGTCAGANGRGKPGDLHRTMSMDKGRLKTAIHAAALVCLPMLMVLAGRRAAVVYQRRLRGRLQLAPWTVVQRRYGSGPA
ncbi:MAG: hypothetical protein U5K33_06190 [Halofilum sp. (in: g-proteobacteria)]|nr:hypothetical protein [Halofilum sp. (in: g-proteobacteria)]